MLQQCAIDPPLGTTDNLEIMEQEVFAGSSLEAQKRFVVPGRKSTPGILGARNERNPPDTQGTADRGMHPAVDRQRVFARSIRDRQDQAVGQFAIMENGSSPGAAANDRHAGTGLMRLPSAQVLKVADAERCWIPLVEAEDWGCTTTYQLEQRLIDGHILRA